MSIKNISILIKQEWDSLNNKNKDLRKVLLHEPTFDQKEIIEVVKCMLSTNVTMGKRVLGFEEKFGKKFNFLNSII